MPLTQLQRRTLQFYRDHQHQPPTVQELLQRGALQHFLRIVLAAVFVVFADSVGMATFGFLGAGILIGSVLRDIAVCRVTVTVWPLLQQVLNFDRVDELLTEPGQDVGVKR